MIATPRAGIVACAAAAVVLTAAARVEGAASLSDAKELYASAAYGEALGVLDSLMQGAQAGEDRQDIDLYRVLCLVALGRRADADGVAEAMIQQDPFYRPGGADIPPRMRAAFTDARKRVLPAVVQQDYRAAKAAFDRKEFSAAADGFDRMLKVLAEPDIAADASQPPLSDLKTLAEGFRDLSAKAIAPAPRPAVPAREVPVPGRTYTSADAQVTPPHAIKQRMPAFRGRATSPAEGLVEVIINATGSVESARMIVPVHWQYDSQVVSAAKAWLYRPATLNGMPVAFKKQLRVTLVLPSPEP